MALKQSRRSISFNRALYERAKAFCHARNIPLAKFSEAAVLQALENAEKSEANAAIGVAVAPTTTG